MQRGVSSGRRLIFNALPESVCEETESDTVWSFEAATRPNGSQGRPEIRPAQSPNVISPKKVDIPIRVDTSPAVSKDICISRLKEHIADRPHDDCVTITAIASNSVTAEAFHADIKAALSNTAEHIGQWTGAGAPAAKEDLKHHFSRWKAKSGASIEEGRSQAWPLK